MTTRTHDGGFGLTATGRADPAVAVPASPARGRMIPCRFVVTTAGNSPESLAAAAWAAREAALRGESLRVVAVPAFPPWLGPGSVRRPVTGAVHQAVHRALKDTADQVVRAEPGLSLSAELLPGTPVQALLDAAWGASMLVTAARSLGSLSAMTLGSVGRYLATHTPCPVVVAGRQAPASRGLIIVGIHDQGHAPAALRFAFGEAALRQARLLVLYGTSWPALIPALTRSPGRPASSGRPEPERWLDSLLADWQRRYPAVTASREVVHTHPAQALVAASARADLLVVGRHLAGTTAGAVIRPVLRHAHSPVAVVASP